MQQTSGIKMTAHEIEAFIDREFPQVHFGGRCYSVDSVSHHAASLRLKAGERHLRPGGTISGPTMMEMADLAMYVALLGAIGPVALAVTTSLNINFLRKPAPGDLVADCRLLKLGKRLVVAEVLIHADGGEDIAAHVTGTYSIPAA
jgi:uncharacterized protein (TIGR00369 family)